MDASITTILREKGFKVTPQRLAVYDVLSRSTAHPSAEMIFNELQPHYPTMSLATVYKTLDIFRDIGLVQILNAGEDSFRYDAIMPNHPHIRCTSCNRIDDLHDVEASDFITAVARTTPYQLTGQQFYFFGLCPSCQKETIN